MSCSNNSPSSVERHGAESEPPEQPRKKQYHSPVLSIYGDIRQLTLAVDNMGMADGGAIIGMRKT